MRIELTGKERLSWEIIATLFILVILYLIACAGIFTSTNEMDVWVIPPIGQIFFFIMGIWAGAIKIADTMRVMQTYILAVSCVCIIPGLFAEAVSLFSFPFFAGWAIMLAEQLAERLKEARSK